MTSWPRRRAVRISEPRMYQASSSRHESADRAQQALGQGDLAGVAGTAAQAGDQRHRTIPARHHERDEALAPQERRPLAAWSKRTATPGRTARRQRVVDHDEAAPRSDLTSDDPAQRRDQA